LVPGSIKILSFDEDGDLFNDHIVQEDPSQYGALRFLRFEVLSVQGELYSYFL